MESVLREVARLGWMIDVCVGTVLVLLALAFAAARSKYLAARPLLDAVVGWVGGLVLAFVFIRLMGWVWQ